MTKLDTTPPPLITFHHQGGPTACVVFKDGKLSFEGDMPVDDAVKLLFNSYWGAIMQDAALRQAVRQAFRAGWRTNAVTETTENADYMAGCEQRDFDEFQKIGLDAWIEEIEKGNAEIAAEEAEAQEVVRMEAVASPPPIIKLPEDFDPSQIVASDSAGITLFSDVSPIITKLVFGPCTLNLDTGELEIPEGMKLDEAAWRFWSAVRTHILQDKNPTLVKHKVRGTTYEVLGLAEGQISVPNVASKYGAGSLVFEGTRLMVYRGEDGKLWWRFPDEFGDGRFEAL